MFKKFMIFLFLFIIISGNALGEENIVNAIMHKEGRYCVIIPEDVSKFNHLGFHPIYSFVFATEEINRAFAYIRRIKVEDLKAGKFYFNGNLFFNKIKGFEAESQKIQTLDEFDVLEIKPELIKKLEECYLNYRQEYQQYLKNSYSFKSYYPNDKNWSIKDISKEDYNFERETITLAILYSVSGLDVWDDEYIRLSKKRFNWDRWKSLVMATVPLPIDDAKKIFSGDQGKAFYDRTFHVKIKDGYVFHKTSWMQNFEITSVIINFYRSKIGIDKPVLSLKLRPEDFMQ